METKKQIRWGLIETYLRWREVPTSISDMAKHFSGVCRKTIERDVLQMAKEGIIKVKDDYPQLYRMAGTRELSVNMTLTEGAALLRLPISNSLKKKIKRAMR
jgi:predicted DNA-binding transcriptional regulator YafY